MGVDSDPPWKPRNAEQKAEAFILEMGFSSVRNEIE